MKALTLPAVFAVGALASTAAFADALLLPADTPIFLQYTNAEQLSASNSLLAGTEGNWGIIQVTSIVRGTALSPTGSDIQGGGSPIFADQITGGGDQILGIFYGINNTTTPGISTGGRLDLYYWDVNGSVAQNTGSELNSGTNLTKRTAQDEYTGFTCASGNTAQCTFLASFTFESGANPGDPGTTVFSPVNPATSDGTSKSYLSVDLSAGGLWASLLDTNYFTLDPCNNPVGHNYAPGETCPVTGNPIIGAGGISFTAAQDVRLDNNFSRNGATAWDVAGTDIIGLRSNDPARAFTAAVPEPGTLALSGLGFLAAALGRRKSKKA